MIIYSVGRDFPNHYLAPPCPDAILTLSDRATGTPANPDDWPKSLRDYVTRCFASCTTDQEKDAAEVFLKNRLKTSETDGDFIWNTDWDNEPTPL